MHVTSIEKLFSLKPNHFLSNLHFLWFLFIPWFDPIFFDDKTWPVKKLAKMTEAIHQLVPVSAVGKI